MRHTPRHPAPARRPLARGRLLCLTGCLLSVPVMAQPTTRTIASGQTVVVQRSDIYGLPAAESLHIAVGGELQGRGGLIGLNGAVQVDGSLRAYTGSENATAVSIGGALTSSATSLLEITHLTVQSGGSVWSGGSSLIGGFRLQPTDPLATVCASTVPCPGNGLQIDGGGSLVLAGGSVGLNYGDIQVSGTFENAGQFTSRNSTNTSGGGPYQQTITVGRDPVFGGGSGLLINRGSLVLQQDNRLVNHSQVFNVGLVALAGGRLDQGATGRLVNRGGLLVTDGAQLVMHGAQGHDSNGAILPALYNAGSMTVDGGGTVHNTWVTQVVHENATASLTIGAAGSFTQGSGAQLALAGGQLLVRGTLTGGGITLDPAAGVAGSVTIDTGAVVDVESYLQTDGTLTVNGRLNGLVQLNGGDLRGGGSGARINGDVLIAGAGGGPPQAPPLCGNAFYACFRPGNSPGHLDIDGMLTMGANSILELEIQRDATGQLLWDSVFASSMHLDGTLLRLLVADGAAGADWATLDLLQCASDCSFNFGAVELVGMPGAGLLQFSSNGLAFALAPAPVPEPASGLLLAAGLAWLARRRLAPATDQSASSGA